MGTTSGFFYGDALAEEIQILFLECHGNRMVNSGANKGLNDVAAEKRSKK
jgi:hypothetical protein